jgi:phosphatidylserine/phosphatidylglycerophosphate/cardiolipin synthase-like enzyme
MGNVLSNSNYYKLRIFRKQSLWVKVIVFFSIVLLCVFIYWQKVSGSDRPPPLEQDKLVRVYFNQNQTRGRNFKEPYRQIERYGDNFEAIIIEAINSAQSSIDLAVQELNLPNLAQALAEKYRSGIKVRVILENTYSRSFGELSASEIEKLDKRDRDKYQEFQTLVDRDRNGLLSPEEINTRDALAILRNAGIPILDDTGDGSRGSGLMHHKFIAIDDRKIITGSVNFTLSDFFGDFSNSESRGNANNLLEITSPELANIFTEEFNLMWGDGVGGEVDSQFGLKKPARTSQQVNIGNVIVEVNFSPTSTTVPWYLSSNGLISRILELATREIDLALFVFSDQSLANTLESKHQQQVAIKALIDPGFAFRYYSEALDMLGVTLNRKCQAEANNNPWKV